MELSRFPWGWPLAVGFLYGGLCFVGLVVSQIVVTEVTARPHPARERWQQLFWAFPAGLMGGLVAPACAYRIAGWARDGSDYVQWVMWGPALLLASAMLVVTLHVGLAGRSLSQEIQEWWLRLGAWLSIYGSAVQALFGIAIYGPLLVYWLNDLWLNGGLTLAWLVTTLAGVLTGKSPATGGEAPIRWPSGSPASRPSCS